MNIEMARQEYEQEREAKRESKNSFGNIQIYKEENCKRRVIDKRNRKGNTNVKKKWKHNQNTETNQRERERRGSRH